MSNARWYKRKLTRQEVDNPSLLPEGSRIYRLFPTRTIVFSSSVMILYSRGHTFSPPLGGCWVSTIDKMQKLANGFVWKGKEIT